MNSENNDRLSYGDAIRHAFEYLFENYPSVFAIGQGLWSPWYVGNTMLGLDKKFGRNRVIDTPVSEAGCTGAAIGASLFGYRPIVIHPRMDFMILATDQIVNQAAKWSYMLGGQASPAVTVRSIVNRGGEQGAQHSQALHSWYAHIPGLRVVMPATPMDARDLLIASVLSDGPVLYIDDRWLYDCEEEASPITEVALAELGPQVLRQGDDVTLAAASYSVRLCLEAAESLSACGINVEVVDMRILNPMDFETVRTSIRKTGRLIAVDGGWSTCGLAGEILARASESIDLEHWRAAPRRIALPDAPAPSSSRLEELYYPSCTDIENAVREICEGESSLQ